jgi:hypothetical protein
MVEEDKFVSELKHQTTLTCWGIELKVQHFWFLP